MHSRKDLIRFMSYVAITDGCWDWLGASLPRGYGRFYFRGKPRYAHRVAVELFRCQHVPDDAVVMHSCDRPCCVNPDHLSIGTQTENMRGASARGRFGIRQGWNGHTNPKAKLSNEQTEEVRHRALSGEKTRNLAAEFGITTTRVWQIKKSSIKNVGPEQAREVA